MSDYDFSKCFDLSNIASCEKLALHGSFVDGKYVVREHAKIGIDNIVIDKLPSEFEASGVKFYLGNIFKRSGGTNFVAVYSKRSPTEGLSELGSCGLFAIKNFTDARQALYDHVGFVEDWVTYPIADYTSLPWCIIDGEYVKYADDMEKFLSDGDYYTADVYKQRFYKKHVYEGKDLTMVIMDTHVDGMKYFGFFANKNRVD